MIEQILRSKSYFLPTHKHEGGATKETHFVKFKNKKYILRICKDKTSRENCNAAFRTFKNKDFLPKLIEEKKNYFLIDFIEGRDLEEEKNEPLEVIEKVGKILAQVNKIKKRFDYKKSFAKYFLYLSKKRILEKQELVRLNSLIKRLSKIKLATCLDISDLTADNFRLSEDKKVFLVDIGAIKPKFAGFGITKAFFQWFKTEEQKRAFKKGYDSISPMAFYSGDYLLLSRLFFIVQVLYYKHLQKKDFKSYLYRLKEIIKNTS